MIKMWIGNIPYNWDENKLIDFIYDNTMIRFPMAENLVINYFDNGKPKGNATIMLDEDFKDEFLSLHGKKADHLKLRVSEHKEIKCKK